MSLGYTITKMHSALELKRYKGLMNKYVELFIKIEITNNGFLTPDQCEEINEDNELWNIDVNRKSEDTKDNPGMKALSKRCLNSLWGKFGQRACLDNYELINDHNRFIRPMTNDKINKKLFM